MLAWYMMRKSYFDPLLGWIREHDKLALPHQNPLVVGYGKCIRKMRFLYLINNIEICDSIFDVLKVLFGIQVSSIY